MYPRQTFDKRERLTGKKNIEQLFNQGKSLFDYPLKAIFLIADAHSALQSVYPATVLIVVPRRSEKKAARRNYIKRLIREAYRKNKSRLYEELETYGKKLTLAILFTGRESPESDQIKGKIISIIHRLILETEKYHTNQNNNINQQKRHHENG